MEQENTTFPFANGTELMPTNEVVEDIFLAKLARDIGLYIYPVVVVVGVLTNILSVIILNNPKIHKTSFSVYLLILAISDSSVLILDFINNFLFKVLGYSVIGLNVVLCRLYELLFNVSFTYSSWLVVALTFERTLAVYMPLKIKVMTSRTRATKLAFIILAMVSLLYGFDLWAWDIRSNECAWSEGWEYFHQNINMWIMGLSYSYIPTIILSVCNVLIIGKLISAFRKRRALQNDQNSKGLTPAIQRTAITAIMISLAFLILTVPLSGFYFIQFSTGQYIVMTPAMDLAENLLLLLGLSNNGINFWIYIFTSSSYRKVFTNLVLCRKYTRNESETGEMAKTRNTAISSSSISVSIASTPVSSSMIALY